MATKADQARAQKLREAFTADMATMAADLTAAAADAPHLSPPVAHLLRQAFNVATLLYAQLLSLPDDKLSAARAAAAANLRQAFSRLGACATSPEAWCINSLGEAFWYLGIAHTEIDAGQRKGKAAAAYAQRQRPSTKAHAVRKLVSADRSMSLSDLAQHVGSDEEYIQQVIKGARSNSGA